MDNVSLGVRQGAAGKASFYSTVSGTFTGKGGMTGMSQTGRRQNIFDWRITSKVTFSLTGPAA